ncbi:MAG: hypothetical protein M1816_008281 [Peltula sp. TS41687]|nr:MAG: hypothetical protein M1816_008281 [Peltula sp. TS41687]
MARTEMMTTQSRSLKSTAPTPVIGRRITRSQSRHLSDSEDNREALSQGQKRKRSIRSNGLGKATVQAPSSEQPTKAGMMQEDIEALRTIAEDSEYVNLSSFDESHPDGRLPQDSEPPGASSSNSVATAKTSYSVQQLTELDQELIIDMLPSLSIASTKILDLLAPAKSTVENIQNLSEDLNSSDSRVSIRLKALRGAFESPRQIYGTDHYINISLIHRALCGAQDLSSLQEALSKPDPILQKANLVTLAITILTSTPSSENGPMLQHLDGCYPGPFLSNLTNGSTSTSRSPTASALLDETFEVGLEIRTRLALALLDIHQEEASYNPEWVIRQLFLRDPDETSLPNSALDTPSRPRKVRGWGVPGLGMADLSAAMKDKVFRRVNIIFSHIRGKPEPSGTGKVDFDALDSLFPWSAFVFKVNTWARRRVNEIETYLRSCGGAEGIENALKVTLQGEGTSDTSNGDLARDMILQKELQVYPSQVSGEPSTELRRDNRRLRGHSKGDNHMAAAPSPQKFDSPNAVALLRRREARLSGRQSMHASVVRPNNPTEQLLHDDRTAASAAPPNQPGSSTSETPLQGSSVNQAQEEVRSQHDDYGAPQDFDEDDRPDIQQAIDSRLPPDSSAGVLQTLSRQLREQDKENRYGEADAAPRKKARYFNETQENAQRIRFDDSESDEQTPRPVERARQMSRTQVAEDDEETEVEFQSDARPVDENRRKVSRRRPRREGNASNKSPRQAERRAGDVDGTQQDQTQPTDEEQTDGEGPTDENQEPLDRIDHARVNRVAKTTVAAQNAHRVQVRRPWEEAATSRLIELIENEKYGTSWSKIEKLNDPLLEGRGQVALKDKARNIKLDFLKAKIALPVKFEDVRLNRNQVQILRDLGIDYQQ